MATFSVTEKLVKVKSELTLDLSIDEARWLLDAANVWSNRTPRHELVKQLWNAVKQMEEIERG